jgi:hypothetical protein
MIEVCSQPTIERVARFAGGRELLADVIRIRSFLIVPQVAGDARRRQALELSDRGALVAIVALHCRVSTQERKTILVISYFLDRDIPALDGVTLRAVRTHLSLVNVGVTILTMLADLGEYRPGMALRALHLFVHAAKRIPRLVVIELRNVANRTPPCRGMAVLTGNRERTMRTSRGHPLRRGKGHTGSGPAEKQQPA